MTDSVLPIGQKHRNITVEVHLLKAATVSLWWVTPTSAMINSIAKSVIEEKTDYIEHNLT